MNYFILPAFNEKGIGLTIANLEKFCLEHRIHSKIILVDDGSTPKLESYLSKNLLNNSSLTLIRLNKNIGPGKAFGAGFKFLPTPLDPDDVVVTLEGDGTSPLNILPEMLDRLSSSVKSYEIALSSPYAIGGSIDNTSLFKKLLSYLANEVFRNLLNLRGIWTISSFYRAFSGEAVNELRRVYGDSIIVMEGFECMVELLWKSKKIGLTICEVSSVVDGGTRQGSSKMKILKTIRGYLRLYVKISMSNEFKKQVNKKVV